MIVVVSRRSIRTSASSSSSAITSMYVVVDKLILPSWSSPSASIPSLTLWTYSRSFQKWACIFTIFHAVVLLDSSN